MKPPTSISSFFFSIALLGLSSCDQNSNTSTPATSTSKTNTRAELQVQNVTVEEAVALLKKDNAPQVIDVRTDEEYASGHIPGAIQIDFKSPDFKEKLGKLDPNREYLIHCRSGGRSTQSLPIWHELGFGKIYHLNKGMRSWNEAGNPTE